MKFTSDRRKAEDIKRDYEAFGLPMTRSRLTIEVNSRVRLNDPRLPKVTIAGRAAKAAAIRTLVGMVKEKAFPSTVKRSKEAA